MPSRSDRSSAAVTALAYVPCVAGMMTVGVFVPFIDPVGRELSADSGELGLALALFSLPAALFATLGSGLIDRHGVRRTMLAELAASALGSLLASQAHSTRALDAAMLLAGAGFGGLCVTAPCLIVAALRDGAQVRAMSFYSTYAPMGYAAGLLLAAAWAGAGADAWRGALLTHAALLALTWLASYRFVPRIDLATPGDRENLRTTVARLVAVIREPRALRLGLGLALPNAISYGTSIVAPAYLARVHHLSVGRSSATVAGAKIVAMVLGGISMGYLLSRRGSTGLLFGVMAGIGLLAQIVLFLPASGMAAATAALIVWIFAFGAMSGAGMTLLPRVAGDAARVAAVSGLVNQFISMASFATPPTWLALQGAAQYVGAAALCLAVSVLALPGTQRGVDRRAP